MFISVTFKTESSDYYCEMFEVEYVNDIVSKLKDCWYFDELKYVCDFWVSNSVDVDLNKDIKIVVSNFINNIIE